VQTHDAPSFADIPRLIRTRLQDGERVLLIVLDAFGRHLLERHRDHPLIERLRIEPLRAQFPTTTTAEMTTLFFDQPVQRHGLYEWNILEPSLQRIICPLRYTPAESRREGELAGQLSAAELAPGPTLYEQLDVESILLLPAAIAGSHFSQMASRGAIVAAFADLGAGLERATKALAGSRYRYAMLYWDEIDATGHHFGPSSAEFDAACVRALDALYATATSASGRMTVLVTADHGQVDVDPTNVAYLDDVWPELPKHLAHARPAGSPRDVFLHVAPASRELVRRELTARLADRADVRWAPELFTAPGPRLLARLGDVAILPSAGGQAWLRSATGSERKFRGQHGGLEPAETDVYLAEVAVA
jgi:hypothetical protein